ncbi:uncharacterized protein LOC132279298 [Cornus florida]|uniref:uncharacterized protein LOC132279298 n=1 Tax=Cornus florida TaxID=4283 RepID=UPI00289C0BEE|nr:uncharacterized protein LOC132279298 [Cornus florida]
MQLWKLQRYYVAPSGKRLRSMVEIQRHLLEHPEYMAKGVTMSQFSFQIPRPLQENYVRKRPTRLTGSYDGNCVGNSGLVTHTTLYYLEENRNGRKYFLFHFFYYLTRVHEYIGLTYVCVTITFKCL